ncbi:MAG: class I SAM-dependent methyltransferase [Bryobacteraceae bacterium]
MNPHAPPLSIIQRSVLRCLPELGLPSGAKVLDAPCGDGALSHALAQAGFEVQASDLQPPASPLPGPFTGADFNQTLPWPDSSFDAVFSLEGIEHLENRFFFLREVNRILRPGGTLVLTTPNISSLRSRVRFLGSGFYHRDSRPLNEARRQPLHHIGLGTFADWRYALHTSGFSLARAGATHAKLISYPYAVFAPWMYIYTLLAFRKEKDAAQRERNRTIRRTLFSRALLFGENLLLVALAHNKQKEI